MFTLVIGVLMLMALIPFVWLFSFLLGVIGFPFRRPGRKR